MNEKIGLSGSSKNATGNLHEPSIITHQEESCCGTGQSTYSATIITPMDSLLQAAAESSSRGRGMAGHSGSGFGERVSTLGSSISHMISDFTHTLSEQAHGTLDKITHTAHEMADAVTSADYKGMVDDTRRTISTSPERNLAIAAGVGIALGLLASRHKD